MLNRKSMAAILLVFSIAFTAILASFAPAYANEAIASAAADSNEELTAAPTVSAVAEVLAQTESPWHRDNVPLDENLQKALWDACQRFSVPYEIALAVIWRETNFSNVTGDGGDSQGYMQIQPRWHKHRMEALGVESLMDPAGNFQVGCQILGEYIASGTLEDALTTYNTGHGGNSKYAEAVIEKSKEYQT